MANSTMLGAAALVSLLSFSGCNLSDSISAEPKAHEPAPATPLHPRTIQIGEVVQGSITTQSLSCDYTSVQGGWGGLCNAFELTAPANGTLATTVYWDADASLALFLKPSNGEQIDLACYGPRMLMHMPVDSGETYRIEVAYVGRGPSYPQIQPVAFTVETSLQPTSVQSSGALQLVVLGDPKRSQRLANARVVVLDGPSAGTSAHFNEKTGFYDFHNLQSGFAQVRVTADGFIAANARLAVGANLLRELVLQRGVPLPDASGSLAGMAWDDGNRNLAYTSVRIEILDGPLAGIFTISDENFGIYWFSGLPPGLMQVRASADGLEAQTRSVVVTKSTTMDFYMRPR